METTHAVNQRKHRLTEAQLADLRARRATGETLRALAKAYSYSVEGIRQLLLATGGDPKPAPEDLARYLIGQRFGRLTIRCAAKSDPKGRRRVLCRCDCGNEKIIPLTSLKNKESQSCGCRKGEWAREHRSHRITFQGRTQRLQEWCRELGLKRVTLSRRLTLGWPIEVALTTPVNGAYGVLTGRQRFRIDPWTAVGIMAELLTGKNFRQVAERREIARGTVESVWYGRIRRDLFAAEEMKNETENNLEILT